MNAQLRVPLAAYETEGLLDRLTYGHVAADENAAICNELRSRFRAAKEAALAAPKEAGDSVAEELAAEVEAYANDLLDESDDAPSFYQVATGLLESAKGIRRLAAPSKEAGPIRHSCDLDMLSDCPACSADAWGAIANDGANPPGDQRQEGETDLLSRSMHVPGCRSTQPYHPFLSCCKGASTPPEAAAAGGEDDPIVGHKTYIDDAGRFSHKPLRQSEANELLAHIEREEQERKRLMPDEKTAINLMWSAWYRLKDFGWSEPSYCPKDGTAFEVIENGSTGIHQSSYVGEWPRGFYAGTSSPALFRPLTAAGAARDGAK